MLKLLLTLIILCSFCGIYAQSSIVDYSFVAASPNIQVNKILQQPDGKILVGGSFTNYGGTSMNNLVRLNIDGTIDQTFNVGGVGPNFLVQDIALTYDEKIVVCGQFSNYNGFQNFAIVRLFSNGQVDPSFNIPDNSINHAVLGIEIQPDNKIIAVGEFFICNGNSQPYIARFTTDGTLDVTYDVGDGFSNSVFDVKLLPDLTILACGTFIWSDGVVSRNIAHLDEDGARIATFSADPGFNSLGPSTAYALAIQDDGKVVIGGNFSYHNGQQITGLARLNMDGSRDLSFNPPFYPYAAVRAIAIQNDGKIVVGGEWTDAMYNPPYTGPNKLIRLNQDGSIDPTFDVGFGIGPASGSFVKDIEIQMDGKILVGGYFEECDDETSYTNLIRLYETNQEDLGQLTLDMNDDFTIFPNPSTGRFHISSSMNNGFVATIQISSLEGKVVYDESNVVISGGIPIEIDLSQGTYLVSVSGETKGDFVKKLVIQ